MLRPPAVLAHALAILIVSVACRSSGLVGDESPESRWWKGNTHTHTLWSDGDDFPEMVADWYRRNGYDFLSITDHNTLADDERWVRIPDAGPAREAFRKYEERVAGSALEQRRSGDTLLVRLRRPRDYRAALEDGGRFLLLTGEEITQYLAGKAAHMNAVNVAEPIDAQSGETLVNIFEKDLAAVRAQEQRTGRNIIAVLNHPNFVWSQTAEDLLLLDDLRFFEVYNGHPLVNTIGDSLHASTERIWDIVLTVRAARGGHLLYGVATDDAHDYHTLASASRRPGRGWVMVRASALAPEPLMTAMERGNFYASTGVALTDVRQRGRDLSLAIRAEPGVTYVTQFIGTRAGYDTGSVGVRDSTGAMLTRRYSPQIGAVLAELSGTLPRYTMRGDELYVRARIVSSRMKPNPSRPGEREMAWTQPIRP